MNDRDALGLLGFEHLLFEMTTYEFNAITDLCITCRFTLVGSSSSTCNAAQMWTDPAPLCVGNNAKGLGVGSWGFNLILSNCGLLFFILDFTSS